MSCTSDFCLHLCSVPIFWPGPPMLPTASRCLRRVSPIHVRCLTVDHIYNPRINSPSSQVWKFKANPRAEQQNSRALKKSSLEVSSDVRSNFARCLEAAARLKLDGTPPDLRTYSALMTSASEAGLWKYAWAILDDMLLMGIKPTVEIFNHLIHVCRGIHPKWLITIKMTGPPSPSIPRSVEGSR